MWGELVRLLGDEESGHTIHLQLKTAIKSQVIEAALSEDRLTRHVGRTSASVADKLRELTRDSGSTDQQRWQQIWITAMPVIASPLGPVADAFSVGSDVCDIAVSTRSLHLRSVCV